MAKVHAHEERFGGRVRELLEVEDREVFLGEQARDGVHNACLVRALQREVVIVAGHFCGGNACGFGGADLLETGS
jgi:hypothetical protein